MSYIMNLVMNATSIAVLVLILFNFGQYHYNIRRTKGRNNQLFISMILTNISLLALDSLTWILNGLTFPGARFLHGLSMAVYYSLQGVMSFIWLLYVEQKLYGGPRHVRRHFLWFALPVVALIVISVSSSFFKPMLYWIDEKNLYHRTSYFWVPLLLTGAYAIYSMAMVLYAHKKGISVLPQPLMRFLFAYPFPPLFGALIQGMFYGVSIIWTGSVISLLIIYINLQHDKVTTDALTGISNRRSYESYMSRRMSTLRGDGILFLFMIDVDHFKQINDRWGHNVGDEALKQTAELLKGTVSRNDFIGRVGGDEFVVCGERDKIADIEQVLVGIYQAVDRFNDDRLVPYRLQLSIGCSTLRSDENKTLMQMQREADHTMYAAKGTPLGD